MQFNYIKHHLKLNHIIHLKCYHLKCSINNNSVFANSQNLDKLY